MADIAWYRKYRPKTIEDYMGEDIKYVVKNRFSSEENRPNVMMLYGNRGCGKTSFARIISKYYLCESPNEDGSPCETCGSCQNINDILINGEAGTECEGVVEVDATTANGKDAIQSIIEDALIAPIYTKYKILILDECHMITPQAQNSLLKIIEDIPPYLIVIFATTNPEKVIGTIHSRCQVKLEVKKKTVEELAEKLLSIAKLEHVETSMEALRIIAKKSDRVPRETINMFENIAKSYGNKVTVANVRSSTGDIAAEIYMEYFKAANSSLEDILVFNTRLKDDNISPKDFITGLTRFTLDCLYIRHAIKLDDYPPEYVKAVKRLFGIYGSNEFDALLQIIEFASREIGTDDVKSELVITTTALRIGKVSLIAEGLSEETMKASAENTRSMNEYVQKMEEEKEAESKRDRSKPATKELLANALHNIVEIKNTANITITDEIPLNAVEENVAVNSEYMSSEDLSKLLDV